VIQIQNIDVILFTKVIDLMKKRIPTIVSQVTKTLVLETESIAFKISIDFFLECLT
jgi:hypothetical protein